MTRRCLLHIGMNKAGSTTIQHCYRDYDDGETYFLPLEGPNHSRLLSLLFSSSVPERFYRSADATDRQAQVAELRSALDQALQADPRSLVISGEELSAFPDQASMDAVASYLRARYERVDGLCYVRDPAGYMASLFQQALKESAPRFHLPRLYPRYRARLAPWVRVLRPRNLQFVALVPQTMRGGTLITDFAARAGLALPPVKRRDVRANAAMTAEAIAVLFALRLAKGTPQAMGHVRLTNSRVILRLKTLGVGRFALDPGAVSAVLAAQQADIDWMQARTDGPVLQPPDGTGDLMVRAEADFLDYATRSLPALQDWFRKEFGGPPQQTDVVGIMQEVYHRVAAET